MNNNLNSIPSILIPYNASTHFEHRIDSRNQISQLAWKMHDLLNTLEKSQVVKAAHILGFTEF